MSKRLAMRSASRKLRDPAFVRTAAVVIVASVMIAGMIALRFGGSAAAEEASAKDASISLAGRWTGQYYGYGRSGEGQGCGDDGCALTYDIVACKDGWCGIAVKADKSCGAAGLHLATDPTAGDHVFKGKLVLEKGAASYAVQAWHNVDKESGAIELHFVGNTGSELLLFRRSYPFEASLARAGDAVCTIDKATS